MITTTPPAVPETTANEPLAATVCVCVCVLSVCPREDALAGIRYTGGEVSKKPTFTEMNTE